ncbi:hypothetical protein fgpv_066 [Flamingopox virus FGPVKD09]|nr:hypothetical protein C1178_gp066 [Flamingopox virus FGPVKD09]AUD40169.1 hypothetical protein fgpv_066 [Flamingopox virus FGPVKD09]
MVKIVFAMNSRKDIDVILYRFHEMTNYAFKSVYQRFCYRLQCSRMGKYHKTVTFRNTIEPKIKELIKKIRGFTVYKITIQPEEIY